MCFQDCLSPLSMQALPAAPESLCVVEMGGHDVTRDDVEGGTQSGLFLNIGLQVCWLLLFVCLAFSYCSVSASEMTYIVSSGALNSTHSLTLTVQFRVSTVAGNLETWIMQGIRKWSGNFAWFQDLYGLSWKLFPTVCIPVPKICQEFIWKKSGNSSVWDMSTL